ncbi:hypothetical protein BP5796_13220 [Coleophoma crateriformis]|uniref:SnoaL-like domain-containing protein n=1 Tax=Coleophoma crateriformis TaxID=565419 RepID=A0A3D8Q433_9HELO|nr:hypothetical protein BP5796_13220 [Coleophoma crateriformis]
MATVISHPDDDFINNRQALFTRAFQSGSTDNIVALMSDSVEFSDYGTKTHLSSKPEVRNYFTQMFNTCESWDIKTISVSGHKHFTAWEWELLIKVKSTEQGEKQEKEADSNEIKLLGVSTTWWDEEGKLMVKNHDYAQHVE